MKPWLLEVNVGPSLSSGSPLDKTIKTSLLTDTLNLLGFSPYDRRKGDRQYDKKRTSRLLATAGMPKRSLKNMTAADYVMSYEDACMIADTEDENYRRGYFTRIFPEVSTLDYYQQFFETVRYNNALLWHWMRTGYKSLEPHFTRVKEIYNI